MEAVAEVVAEAEGGGVGGEALEVVEDLVEGGGGLGVGGVGGHTCTAPGAGTPGARPA